MSSETDSLKKPAEELSSDEPDLKKAKVSDEHADKQESTADAKSNSNDHNETPSKTVNGKSENVARHDEDSHDIEGSDGEDDEDEEDAEVLDPKIANCLEQVEGIQLEICNLNEKASEEILNVEKKFNTLRRPHFEKRNELLKEIPNFWLTSMANHPIIAPMIESAEDDDCLRYLVNLDVEEFEDIKSGYKIKLQFVDNPYIDNEFVVKQFQIINSEEILSAVSPPIEFKNTPKGQKLKQIVDESIAQHRRSRRPGLHSFFAWLIESSEGTDEVAETIKDQLWPNPLEYFFARPEDEYGGMSDDESDDEDEEIDEEEMDDDVAVIGRDSGSEIEIDDEEEDLDEEDLDDEDVE